MMWPWDQHRCSECSLASVELPRPGTSNPSPSWDLLESDIETQAYRATGSTTSGVVAAGVVVFPGGAGFVGDGLGRVGGVAEHVGDDGGWRMLEYLAQCSGSDVQVGDAEALEP